MNNNSNKVPALVDQVRKGPSTYQETVLYTDNTRLAAVWMVFGAALLRKCPLEWIDLHRNRETFLRYLENPGNPEYQPKPKVTFNFQEGQLPCREITKAFESDYDQLDSKFEGILASLNLPEDIKEEIRAAVSGLIARACHEVLLKREELVRLIKRVPRNAKFDQIISGGKLVRLGKNCSPETRAHYLSKLPG